MHTCSECRDAYCEYKVLAQEGIPHLAARYGLVREEKGWDGEAARRKLFARIVDIRAPKLLEKPKNFPIPMPRLRMTGKIDGHPSAALAAVACIVVAISVGAFWYGRRIEATARQAVTMVTVTADDRVQKLTSEKQAVDDLLNAQGQKLELLQAESSEKQREIDTLQSELVVLRNHADELAASDASSDMQIRSVSQQRDALSAQLQDSRHGFDAVQAELVGLQADRAKSNSRLASLEAQVSELSTTNRDLQSNADSDVQFLSSDRDIRELMGARNLYIADVFDVDGSSRTRKPFGRVFYTQGKSLIFYAFDLDRQPRSRNASAFQAWGQKETPQGETAQPVNLGILYMDNETNRRWALRCDDPRQLAEIDAVFVTIEPHGGSQKPTGKPPCCTRCSEKKRTILSEYVRSLLFFRLKIPPAIKSISKI